MSKDLSQIKAVLFDVDGVLVDSGDAHIYSIRAALSEMGINEQLTDCQIKETIGNPIENIFKRLVAIDEIEEDFRRTFRRKMYEDGGIEYLKPYPGVKETLRQLHAMRIRTAIVTNKRRSTTKIFLKKVDIETSMFEFVITGEDVKRYKPAPDAVLLALKKLGLRPLNVALVGDTILDIEAANNAGITSIAVECGFGKDLQSADLVIQSVKDLAGLLSSTTRR